MKFYIDEPDLFSEPRDEPCPPLIGVTKDTQFFETREEAERECERLEKLAEICFCVFEAK